jgi:uncharacterized protein with GYD domain
MALFLMYGKHTAEGLKDMIADRTKAAVKMVKQMGGKIQSMCAAPGEHDLACVVQLPSNAEIGLCRSRRARQLVPVCTVR